MSGIQGTKGNQGTPPAAKKPKMTRAEQKKATKTGLVNVGLLSLQADLRGQPIPNFAAASTSRQAPQPQTEEITYATDARLIPNTVNPTLINGAIDHMYGNNGDIPEGFIKVLKKMLDRLVKEIPVLLTQAQKGIKESKTEATKKECLDSLVKASLQILQINLLLTTISLKIKDEDSLNTLKNLIAIIGNGTLISILNNPKEYLKDKQTSDVKELQHTLKIYTIIISRFSNLSDIGIPDINKKKYLNLLKEDIEACIANKKDPKIKKAHLKFYEATSPKLAETLQKLRNPKDGPIDIGFILLKDYMENVLKQLNARIEELSPKQR